MANRRARSGKTGVELDLGTLNPKQKRFCQARSKYIAYGGARGGGKTHVVRLKAVMGCLAYPGIRILIVRREYPELEQTVILPMRKLVPPALAAYNGTMHMMTFANGSTIKFGHYGSGDDLEYQGQEYDWIFMDEATQFTEQQFRTLGACLRGTSQIPRRIYLTCNPGGVGHFWVKRLFVTRDYQTDRGERPEDYTFIAATVEDNPQLMRESPDYIQSLNLLPEEIRRAHRYGDWDALSGTFFPEVRRESHVVPDFQIPRAWRKYRAFDYGLDMLACLWIAVDFDGRCWVYRECSRPGLTVSEAARTMLELTPPGEEITATLAPPDMWSRTKDTGKTMAEIFMESGLGIVKASNSRVQGWMALKELLKPMGGAGERPGLVILAGCPGLLENLQTIQHSGKDPNDCAVEPHGITHAPDALRYFAVTRTLPAERPEEREEPEPEMAELTGYDEAMTGGDLDAEYLRYGG